MAALGEHHHRRAGQAVIVGGHGVVVRAGGAHRHHLPALGLGEIDVGLDDVAAFAAPPHHVAQKVRLVHGAGGQQHGILGAIKGIAGVVGHAAVDGDIVLIPRDLLHRAHGVEGEPRVGHDAPPRLHVDIGHIHTQLPANFFHACRHPADGRGDVHMVVAVHVPDAVAAAHVQLGKRGAEVVPALL